METTIMGYTGIIGYIYWGPMLNKLLPFEGLNIRIPIIIPIKGKGVINQGSGLGTSFGFRTCVELVLLMSAT